MAYKSGVIGVVLACIFCRVAAQEPTRFPSASNLTPTVTMSVRVAAAPDTLEYEYTLINSARSVQKVSNFSIACNLDVALTTVVPPGWISSSKQCRSGLAGWTALMNKVGPGGRQRGLIIE